MRHAIEVTPLEGGRWRAEVRALAGVVVEARTRDEAIARARNLALRSLSERLQRGESLPDGIALFAAKAVAAQPANDAPGRRR